jgi:hypothetical protein
MARCNGGIPSSAARNLAALMRRPRPETCMYVSCGARSFPSTIPRPVMPSRPMIPTSMLGLLVPSAKRRQSQLR